MRDYAKNGYLLDISDMFEDGRVDLTKFPQHVIDIHTVNGTLWGIPKDFDSIAVFYNKDMFDAAGVDYPSDDWTWDEFIEIAKALTDAENGIYGVAVAAGGQAWGYDYIYGNGGEVFDENGACVVNSPEAVEAIQRESRRYAKRQLTWLRRDKGLHWILWDNEPEPERAAEEISALWTAGKI